MGLHGDFADTELTSDLLVQLPSNHQRHPFPFATAKRLVAITECLQARLFIEGGPSGGAESEASGQSDTDHVGCG